MAYLMMVIGLAYSVIWAAGLLFTSKSDGPKNVVVPALGLLAFLGLTAVSASAAKQAMDSPEQLTPMPTSRSSTTRASRRWSVASVQRWRTRTVQPTT